MNTSVTDKRQINLMYYGKTVTRIMRASPEEVEDGQVRVRC